MHGKKERMHGTPIRHVTNTPPLSQTMQACRSDCPRRRQSWQKKHEARRLPQNRAEQFRNDFHALGDLRFCKFCQHTVSWKRVDTCKDHLQSKAHVKNMDIPVN